MTDLRCIAIDDEAHALRLLEMYASKTPGINLLATFNNPLEAIPFLEKEQVDLLFLDIQMPELTGLQFLSLLQHPPQVVLTTAYTEYALESYDYAVTDYLLKPFALDRFVQAVQRAKARQKSDTPATPAATSTGGASIFLKGDAKNKFHRIQLAEVRYVEGLHNHVRVHLQDGSSIITLTTLRRMAEQLPGSPLLRVHKSYIVNMDQVSLLDGHRLQLGDHWIPIGARYRANCLEWINQRRLLG